MNLSINCIGVIYGQLNNYEKALEYFLKSLEINEEIGNKKGISYSLGNIGILYRRLKKYDKAIEYLLESLKIEEEIGNKVQFFCLAPSLYVLQKKKTGALPLGGGIFPLRLIGMN